MTEPKGNNPIVALVAAIFGIGLVVFVFVYGDLKTNPFVQGITGLLVTLLIAVVLFSAVPGSKAVTRPLIGLAGAAAFYFVILPRVQPFIFPFYSFTGYVAYENVGNSNEGFAPVQGADVEIKGTGLRATTNAGGQFIIPNVPSQITISELIISRGGKFHTVQTERYPDKIFRIPNDPDVIKSTNYPIGSGEWIEDRNKGCPSERNKYHNKAQFSLTKTVPNDVKYSDLIFKVWCPDVAIEIITAKLTPSTGVKVKGEEDYSRAQKWQLPLNGDRTELNVLICAGAIEKNKALTRSSLQAAYWFEKVE